MAIFFFKEIESQYNLIKMLLSAKTRYQNTIAVKKNISYLPIELKKKFKKENNFLKREKFKDGFNMISIL